MELMVNFVSLFIIVVWVGPYRAGDFDANFVSGACPLWSSIRYRCDGRQKMFPGILEAPGIYWRAIWWPRTKAAWYVGRVSTASCLVPLSFRRPESTWSADRESANIAHSFGGSLEMYEEALRMPASAAAVYDVKWLSFDVQVLRKDDIWAAKGEYWSADEPSV